MRVAGKHKTWIVVLFSLGLIGIFIPVRPSSAYELLLGTGEKEDFSFYAGRQICRAINSLGDETTCRPVVLSNYAASLTNLQTGALDVALVNGKMIHDAVNSEGVFRYLDIRYDALRMLLPVYRQPISMLVRSGSGIATFDDLVGKSLNVGPVHSMSNILFSKIRGARGWKEKDFLSYQTLPKKLGQDSLAFSGGHIQAMVQYTMHPDEKIARQIDELGAKIIGVDGPFTSTLLGSGAGFHRYVIEAGTYAGLEGDVSTLAVETYLLTSSVTDEQTVTLILKAIQDNRQRLRKAHPALFQEHITSETLEKSIVPPHREVLRFFKFPSD